MKKVILLFCIAALVLTLSCGPKTEDKSECQVPVGADTIYYEKGKSVTSRTQKALGSKLKAAISTEGVSGAVQFCNINALPITASMSDSMGVRIKRTSLKWRNPANRPNEQETMILRLYESGKLEASTLSKLDSGIAYYEPIRIQPLCLNCHGPEKKLSLDLKKRLEELYPDDHATGYELGELRGMWAIEFY